MLISSNRLWIGTGNGVIISVPLNECSGTNMGAIALRTSGGCGSIRMVTQPGGSTNNIPYCTMAHAQLSFHGHRDPVKFFVSVPGSGGLSAASASSPNTATSPDGGDAQSAYYNNRTSPNQLPAAMLVLSGGEGYIDFRIGKFYLICF